MKLTQLEISLQSITPEISFITHSPGQTLTYQLHTRWFCWQKSSVAIPGYCATGLEGLARLGSQACLCVGNLTRRQVIVVEISLFATLSGEMDSQRKEVRVRKDPWARFEAWRYHPAINKRANMRNFLPGFWWGVGAFVIAVGIEKLLEKPDDHGEHHWLHWIFYSTTKKFYRLCLVKKLLYGWSEKYFCIKEPGRRTLFSQNHSWNSLFRFSGHSGLELISFDYFCCCWWPTLVIKDKF